jgi:hypothetical protein
MDPTFSEMPSIEFLPRMVTRHRCDAPLPVSLLRTRLSPVLYSFSGRLCANGPAVPHTFLSRMCPASRAT